MNRESQQSLVLTVGVESLVGRMRSHNEDSFAVFAPEAESSHRSGLDGLLLVADGMGGQAAGDVASSLAANRIREWADGLRQSGFSSSATDAIEQARDSLTDAFLDTNETI